MKGDKKADKKADKKSTLQDQAVGLITAGKYDQAESILSDLLTAHPGDSEVCRLLATLQLRRGNLRSAQTEFRFLAETALAAKDHALAESIIREYLGDDPRCAMLLELLGRTYEDKGDAAAAAVEYGKAVEALLEHPDPEDPTRPFELYDKIKALAPTGPDAARLAPVFAPPPAERSLEPAHEPIEPPAPVLSGPAEPLPPPLPAEVVAELGLPESPALPEPAPVPPPEPVVPDITEQDERVPFPPVNQPSSVGLRLRDEDPVEQVAEQGSGETPPIPEMEGAETGAPDEPAVGYHEEPPIPPTDPVEPARPARPPEERVELSEEAEAPPVQEVSVREADRARPSAAPIGEPSETVAAGQASVFGAPSPESWPRPVPGDIPAAEHADDYAPVSAGKGAEPQPVHRSARAIQQHDGWSLFLDQCRKAVRASLRVLMLLAGIGAVVPLVLLGLLAVVWLAIEQKPDEAFRELTNNASPQISQEPANNGYFLLLGFSADATVDPVQEGYEQWRRGGIGRSLQCFGPVDQTPGSRAPLRFAAETDGLTAWFRVPDPITRFQQEKAWLNDRVAQHGVLMSRYRRWLTMSFEDGGYGRLITPECSQVLTAHRLYVAEGMSRSPAEGMDRLEKDLLAWRGVLTEAKTLPTKLLAAAAVGDDAAILADLLTRPGADAAAGARLAKLAQPLDHVERSLRWAMQSEFLLELRQVESGWYKQVAGQRSVLARALSFLPLPKQRILNAYARYYDQAIKDAYTPNNLLPHLYAFASTPPHTVFDYLLNPIDNVLAPGWKPSWEDHAHAVLETDARLRLAGLLASAAGPSRETNWPARVAAAGPKFSDPFTGLPMLLDRERGVLYSVGRNGRDDRGDPLLDLSVSVASRKL